MTEVFIRKSSGMAREFSWVHLLIINCFTTVLMIWPAFTLASTVSSHPEANVLVAAMIAFLPALPFILVYWMFSSSMPRSGGDYVFLSRVLSAPVGFILNFTLAMVIIYYNAIWIVSAMNPALSNTFLVLGVRSNNAMLIDLAFNISSPVWTIGIGVIFLVFFAILAIVLRPGGFGRVLLVIFTLATLFVIPSFLIPAASSQADFAVAFNNFAAALGAPKDYYSMVIQTADLEAMVGPYPVVTLSAILGAFVLPYWNFQWTGFLTSYVSGEVKEVKRSQLFGMAGCLVVSLIVAFASLTLLYGTGSHFIHSLSFLYYAMPADYVIYPAFPGLNFVAQILTDNLVVVTLIGLGYFLYFIVYTLITLVAISRCFFAWSFDRVIPSSLADVHTRFRTPYKSIIVLTLISIMFLFIVGTVPVFFPFYWVVIPNNIPWIAVSIAAIIFPYRKKEIFESSPVNYRIGGIPVISLLGAISLIPQVIQTSVLMFDPAWSWAGAISPTALGLTVGMIGFAAILYFGVKAYRKSRGIDISLAFKAIPPE